MKPTIRELIAPYTSVSIIGMCKNAGKTTVLNELIRELSAAGCVLGLTSIGRDGESKDLVTGTHKPGIYVREGTLVATASDLILHHCDVTREVLTNTDALTAFSLPTLRTAVKSTKTTTKPCRCSTNTTRWATFANGLVWK